MNRQGQWGPRRRKLSSTGGGRLGLTGPLSGAVLYASFCAPPNHARSPTTTSLHLPCQPLLPPLPALPSHPALPSQPALPSHPPRFLPLLSLPPPAAVATGHAQATHSGFGFISQENVFKVCDQPHPKLVMGIIAKCKAGDLDAAYAGMKVRVRVCAGAWVGGCMGVAV